MNSVHATVQPAMCGHGRPHSPGLWQQAGPSSAPSTASSSASSSTAPRHQDGAAQSLSRRLRIRQRLNPQVYLAELHGEQFSFRPREVVVKSGRLLRAWEPHVGATGIAQELRIARQLRAFGGHSNVVKILETHVEHGVAFVVMEHCTGGDLFAYLASAPATRLSQAEALDKLLQVTRAVHYLHQRNIAHRDLSLENVLLLDGVCKVCDFGLSTRADMLSVGVVGKTHYVAPEVVAGDWYDPVRADIWSLGVMLFMLLTGSPLLAFASPACREFAAVKAVGVRGLLQAWRMDSQFSAATLDLLTCMLQFDPAQRVASTKELLSHPALLAAAATRQHRELTAL